MGSHLAHDSEPFFCSFPAWFTFLCGVAAQNQIGILNP